MKLVGASKPDTGTHDFVTDQEVDEFARQHNVELRRTGYLPPQQASDELASSSIISLPFEHGASQRSGALIAALSMGRPVVTTTNVVRDDLDGLSTLPQLIGTPPGDIESLHNVLANAPASDVEHEPLPESYQWPAIAASHRDLYRSLLDRDAR